MTTILIVRMLLIVTIVVAVTDAAIFWDLKKHPEHLTIPYLILWIIVTIVPIAINVWVHMHIS
jgi:hypothetical protein